MDPKLLILDEATSALDAESEHLVQEAIDRAMVNRTVIVIAHRLSTVINANEVLVVQNGEIRERGTHSVLMEKNGIYTKLVRRQWNLSDKGGEKSEIEEKKEEIVDDLLVEEEE